MTTSPQSPLPPGRAYPDQTRSYTPAADRQPVRVTGTLRTKPGIWRIAWGVCLGLFLYSLIAALIGIGLLLLAGVSLNDEVDRLSTLGAATSTLVRT